MHILVDSWMWNGFEPRLGRGTHKYWSPWHPSLNRFIVCCS